MFELFSCACLLVQFDILWIVCVLYYRGHYFKFNDRWQFVDQIRYLIYKQLFSLITIRYSQDLRWNSIGLLTNTLHDSIFNCYHPWLKSLGMCGIRSGLASDRQRPLLKFVVLFLCPSWNVKHKFTFQT